MVRTCKPPLLQWRLIIRRRCSSLSTTTPATGEVSGSQAQERPGSSALSCTTRHYLRGVIPIGRERRRIPGTREEARERPWPEPRSTMRKFVIALGAVGALLTLGATTGAQASVQAVKPQATPACGYNCFNLSNLTWGRHDIQSANAKNGVGSVGNKISLARA